MAEIDAVNVVRRGPAVEEAQVCEALVREIGQAERWSAVVDAWCALIHVRMLARNLNEEYQRLCPDGNLATLRGGAQ